LFFLSSHKKCKHNVAGPVLVPLKNEEYILSKKFDEVNGTLCLKFYWKQRSPKSLQSFIDNINDSQSFLPRGLEYIYNVTMTKGKHDIKLLINTCCGVERIEECSQRGMQFCNTFVYVLHDILLFLVETNATSWKAVSAFLGDVSSCQVISNKSSDEYVIKESDCSSKKNLKHSNEPCGFLNITCEKLLKYCDNTSCYCVQGEQNLGDY
jgi:hypothetical protein